MTFLFPLLTGQALVWFLAWKPLMEWTPVKSSVVIDGRGRGLVSQEQLPKYAGKILIPPAAPTF